MGVADYYIGKGLVSFKKDGLPTFRDVGNVPELEWQPEIEKLDHFSSRAGVKSKDKTIIISRAGTVRIVMEEWTPDNLALAFLGAITIDSGTNFIDVFSQSEVTGQLKFVGTNTVGTKFELLLLSVSFIPGGSVQLLSEEWGQLELNGAFAQLAPIAWAPTTAYVVGDVRKNSTGPIKIYECITAGTSAGSGGPTTYSQDITDGTVHWKFVATADASGASFGTLKNLP